MRGVPNWVLFLFALSSSLVSAQSLDRLNGGFVASTQIITGDGTAATPAVNLGSTVTPVGIARESNTLLLVSAGGAIAGVNNSYGLSLRSDGQLSWMSSSSHTSAPPDVTLYRDAANTLAQRNGANNQAFHVYTTYTDASNYKRLVLGRWGNSGDTAASIWAEGAGTGVNPNFYLGTYSNNTGNLSIVGGGNIHFTYQSDDAQITAVGTAPTPSTCGDGVVSTGSNSTTGRVTSAATMTACTLTFATTFGGNGADCVITNLVAARGFVSAASATAFTVSGLTAGDDFMYHCFGR